MDFSKKKFKQTTQFYTASEPKFFDEIFIGYILLLQAYLAWRDCEIFLTINLTPC